MPGGFQDMTDAASQIHPEFLKTLAMASGKASAIVAREVRGWFDKPS